MKFGFSPEITASMHICFLLTGFIAICLPLWADLFQLSLSAEVAKVSIVSPKNVVLLWSVKVLACFCIFVTKLFYENAQKFPVTRKLMLESSIQELIACATLVYFHCSIHIFAGFVSISCLTPCLLYSNSMSIALILNQV